MARIGYVGEGTSLRRLLNNSPAVSAAYWGLRKALNDGVVAPKIRMLTTLATDATNHCRY